MLTWIPWHGYAEEIWESLKKKNVSICFTAYSNWNAHGYFPVNLTNFLRTDISQYYFKWLFLNDLQPQNLLIVIFFPKVDSFFFIELEKAVFWFW